jgi:uncharacterized membrane protein YgcG
MSQPKLRPAWVRHRQTGITFNHREDDTYSSDCGGNILTAVAVTSLLTSDNDDHGFEISNENSTFSAGDDSFSGGGGSFGGGGADGSY